MPTAANLLKDAADLVGGDRHSQHGDKRANMQNIADMWNALLYAKFRRDGSPDAGFPSHLKLTAVDVASMMELMKVARRYLGSHNIDDYLDAAGYAAVAAEVYDGSIPGQARHGAEAASQTSDRIYEPGPVVHAPPLPQRIAPAPAALRRIDEPSTGTIREYPKDERVNSPQPIDISKTVV